MDIFYREAGPKDAPNVLLLHGFPTSSHMFRNLIPALSDKYHVVAPDYPGYGNSSMPSVEEFDYTFDRMAELVETFTEKLGLETYSIYLMDYGAPIGFRLAAKYPEPCRHAHRSERKRVRGGSPRVLGSRQGLLEGQDTGEPRQAQGIAHHRCHQVAVHARGP